MDDSEVMGYFYKTPQNKAKKSKYQKTPTKPHPQPSTDRDNEELSSDITSLW